MAALNLYLSNLSLITYVRVEHLDRLEMGYRGRVGLGLGVWFRGRVGFRGLVGYSL